MLKRFWSGARRAIGSPRTVVNRKTPIWETLEDRQMLSGAGVDYALSGFTWSNPKDITYSIPKDGVSWDQGYNNLNADLDASYSGTSWKREIARALQTWASVANLNVVPTGDSNADFNARGLAQGDPNFGDIRVGGYDFGSLTTLAQTYYPPPNGVTASGDIEVNTGFQWGATAPYDLYSVLLHETGHSLGLAHSTQPTAVMNAVYGGVRTGLTDFDIEGIQAMYGARVADTYQASGQGISPATAINVTGGLNATNGITLSDTSLATIGDVEYFSIVAPTGLTNESLQAVAQASGLSSLSPKISVFDSAMNLLGSIGDANAWGNDATLNLGSIQPGQKYTVAVTGATNDVFAVGSYALKLNFAGTTATPPPVVTPPVVIPPPVITPPPIVTPPPVVTPPVITPPPVVSPPVVTPPVVTPPIVTPPVVTKPVVTPPSDPSAPVVSPTLNLGSVTATMVTNQSLASAWNVNLYSFVAPRAGTVTVATGSTAIQIANQYGQLVASGTGQVSFQSPKAGIRYFVVLTSSNGQAVPQFSLAIVTTLAPAHPAAPTGRLAKKPSAKKAREVIALPVETESSHATAPQSWNHHRVAVVPSHWSKHK